MDSRRVKSKLKKKNKQYEKEVSKNKVDKVTTFGRAIA